MLQNFRKSGPSFLFILLHFPLGCESDEQLWVRARRTIATADVNTSTRLLTWKARLRTQTPPDITHLIFMWRTWFFIPAAFFPLLEICFCTILKDGKRNVSWRYTKVCKISTVKICCRNVSIVLRSSHLSRCTQKVIKMCSYLHFNRDSAWNVM